MLDKFCFVDLTHTITCDMPTWSGSCGFKHEVKKDYDEGVRVLKYTMHAAAGTHMDAPSHFFEEGKSIADIELEKLIVPCSIIDLSFKCHEDLWIEPEDIIAFEKKYGKILPNSFVIGFTGWQKFWHDPAKYRNLQSDGKMHFPGFSKASAEFLLERDIAGLGIDTLSPDGSDNEIFPVHHLVLGEGKYIVENLAHLEKMPKYGGYVLVLPIKIGIGTEACVRCIGAFSK